MSIYLAAVVTTVIYKRWPYNQFYSLTKSPPGWVYSDRKSTTIRFGHRPWICILRVLIAQTVPFFPCWETQLVTLNVKLSYCMDDTKIVIYIYIYIGVIFNRLFRSRNSLTRRKSCCSLLFWMILNGLLILVGRCFRHRQGPDTVYASCINGTPNGIYMNIFSRVSPLICK